MNCKLLLFAILISLVLSDLPISIEPTTGIKKILCTKPCYGPNVSPCSKPNYICQNSSYSLAPDYCKSLCLPASLSKSAHLDQSTICSEPCSLVPEYKCSKYEWCNYHPELGGCYNCDNYCKIVNCFVDPCILNSTQKECAMKVSPNSVCISNYCGGCNAEWYYNGQRICELAGQVKCPTCRPCIRGYKQGFNQTTGCPICKCLSLCPLLFCPFNCPNGYAEDANGCPTCMCKPCPPVCQIFCFYGHKRDPITGCELCSCNPPPTPICPLIRCTQNMSLCAYGQAQDANGCPICRCRSAPCPHYLCPIPLDCPNGWNRNADGCITCGCKPFTCPKLPCPKKICLFGYALDSRGCPTCNCLPQCNKFCPYGYTFTNQSFGCKCNCLPKICIQNCPYGYEEDIYGCPTCVCKKIFTICPKIRCDIFCPNGYAEDANGCPICGCKPKCTGVPIPCIFLCKYGYHLKVNECNQCLCAPCPPVTCLRYCPYGYQSIAGCPTCLCNPPPICPKIICPLICSNGYRVDWKGCPICSCKPYPPCKCPVKPQYQILCPDRINTAGYTNICIRLPSGECRWLFRSCPLIITINVPTSVTSVVVQSVLNLIDIPYDPSIQIILKKATKTTETYQITIPAELLPNINITSTAIIKSITQALTLHGDATVTLVQSHDAVVEDKNIESSVFSLMNSTLPGNGNDNGRIFVFISLLVFFILV